MRATLPTGFVAAWGRDCTRGYIPAPRRGEEAGTAGAEEDGPALACGVRILRRGDGRSRTDAACATAGRRDASEWRGACDPPPAPPWEGGGLGGGVAWGAGSRTDAAGGGAA